MSEKVISLEVRPRGKSKLHRLGLCGRYANYGPAGKPIRNLPKETYVRPSDSGKDVYERIAAKARTDINRLRITKSSDGSVIPNDGKVTVDSLLLDEGTSIFVKDLGESVPT